MNEPKLCYVENHRAHLTTTPLDQVWGDDWDSWNYAENAGPPSCEFEETMTCVMYSGPFYTPAERDYGGSVAQINAGGCPWLWSLDGGDIWAGTTLSEFKKKIREQGGSIYVLETPEEAA